MRRRGLVTIVIGLRGENDMERYVEVPVVDGPIQFRGQAFALKVAAALVAGESGRFTNGCRQAFPACAFWVTCRRPTWLR